MKRRLFCELSPLTWKISRFKCCMLRHLQNVWFRGFAEEQQTLPLPFLVYTHRSRIRRTLGGVDARLQNNKAENLRLAAPKINGLLIRPGQTFSFWKQVGACTARRGYQEGLIISCDGRVSSGVGGGMCQMSNLIHWLVLHTPMRITEHHHHDSLDLFPDSGRTVPFGTGTSIAYNNIDYRFYNDTDAIYQLMLRVDEDHLVGEIRIDRPQTVQYHICVEDEHFVREPDGIYRCGRVVRTQADLLSGRLTSRECLKENHAKIIYDEQFVQDRIRA